MIRNQTRILLIKLSSFGDVLHALPTLEAIRAAFPGGHITWLVEAAYAPPLAGHPALDEVWPVPRVRLGQRVGRGELLNLMRLMRRVRTTHFDLVIDLQGLLKSAMWVVLTKSPRKVGYDRTRELSSLALTERIPRFDPEAHAVWRYLNVARYLGAPPTLPRFRLGLTPIFPDSLIPPDRAFVVLHPGARWPTKLWPPASWARLADWLIGEKGLAVVITGSAADRHLAAQIIEHMHEKAWNLAGRTTLAELAGIMQKARLAITADTGPMHLAAALGTRVVAIFGPTAPGRTGPFGEGHRVVRLGLECSPCFQRRCPEPRCLTTLSPDAVQAAVEKSL
ncbi:MAG: lipopolysaccharide heptosyltransferase II [Deltaproteobacteria bacterium]|nr:lipopolysaccharide heptosyltransferase II [Deltaproteobacteria bacterium]